MFNKEYKCTASKDLIDELVALRIQLDKYYKASEKTLGQTICLCDLNNRNMASIASENRELRIELDNLKKLLMDQSDIEYENKLLKEQIQKMKELTERFIKKN